MFTVYNLLLNLKKKVVKEKVIKKSFEILTKIQATHSKAKNIVYNPGPHTVGA